MSWVRLKECFTPAIRLCRGDGGRRRRFGNGDGLRKAGLRSRRLRRRLEKLERLQAYSEGIERDALLNVAADVV